VSTAVATAPATFYAVVGNSDYYWRVTAPARSMGAKTCLIPEMGGAHHVCTPNEEEHFPWGMDEDHNSSYPAHEGGAAVWTRPDLLRAIHARAMAQQHGIRTVSESDDNYMSNVKFNIYMKSNGFGEDHRMKHLQAMASHDACIFSTAYLRDAYHKAFKEALDRRHVPTEMYVVENHVFEEDWPEPIPMREDGKIRVGWMGSPSHIWDVDLAWGALLAANLAGGHVVMIGYDPSNPEHSITSKRSMGKVKQWRKVGFEHIGWQTMDWKSRLALPLDIGLAPLLVNDFTLAKSDIKAIEYTIAGAAVIASNMSVYNQHWVHGETALLAGSPSEMIDHTLLLMRDAKLRRTLVENAQQYVREERSLERNGWMWREAVTGSRF